MKKKIPIGEGKGDTRQDLFNGSRQVNRKSLLVGDPNAHVTLPSIPQ